MSAQEHLNGQLFEGSIKGGTSQLFPSAPYLTGRAKYPRGFTPERLREVQGATRLNPQRDYPPRAGETAAVRDTIARSTVPVEHLRGVHWYTGSSSTSERGAAGSYYSKEHPGFSTNAGAITISPGYGRGATPIHEIGHHVSAYHEENPHSAVTPYGRSPELRGKEEAYAENYADTHFRDRRGRPIPNSRKSPTGSEWTEGYGYTDGDKAHAFQTAFKVERQKSPVVQSDRAARIAHTEKLLNSHPLLPSGHVRGQLPLLEGDMTGSHEQGDERAKWEYTAEQKATGLKRDDPEDARLTSRAAQVRAARLPKGTEVRRAVNWSSGSVR